MTRRPESSAAAEAAALRLRQRQIGRELRLFYERIMREPLPSDMLDSLLGPDRSASDSDAEAAASEFKD